MTETWNSSVVFLAGDVKRLLEGYGRRPRTHPQYLAALEDVAHGLGIRLDLTPRSTITDATYYFSQEEDAQ